MKTGIRIAALLLAALLLCGCGAAAEKPGGLELLVFAAGKADAILLTTENGAVLIDTGRKGFGREIVDELAAQGIQALDCLIITHFDKDHVGGAAKVLKEIPVRRVLQSNCPRDSEEYEKYLAALEKAGLEAETVREPLRFALDEVSFTVDPPREESYEQDPSNNSSLIVSVRCGSCSLLFTGDAENRRMAEWLSGETEEYTLVKMPHHGAWQKTLVPLLERTRPTFAVITDSEEEPASEKTEALLAQYGVETCCTRTAAVLAFCDGETIELSYVGAQEAAA